MNISFSRLVASKTSVCVVLELVLDELADVNDLVEMTSV